MSSALATLLATAYAIRGVPAIVTPAAGTGPVACVAIVGDVDEVASMLATGARVAGLKIRIRQSELAVRPKQGDVVTIPGADLSLRVTLAVTSSFDDEWYLTATPVLVPVSPPPVGVGHLQPPFLFGGGAWG